MSAVRVTGGCQCGAVRYALHAEPKSPLLCYCRMCQKQFGSIFGAFAAIERKDFELTRGRLGRFQSSDIGVRTFCADCGTPMGYDSLNPADTRTWVSLGSLDEPERVRPTAQWGAEARVSWIAEVIALPVGLTGGGDADPTYRDAARIHSRMHPDHDTEVWPPA